ncbi:Phox-like protein [Mycena galopus ATCC 62051]|nr:Phox-like protein [Mycena galopus ATCC 62051]
MSTLSPPSSRFPFAHSTSRLEIIPNGIDVEEESRLYDDLVFDASPIEPQPPKRPYSPVAPPNNSGESAAFAREVNISGWTSVGMRGRGLYDCVIKTKEGTPIHAHKRYSDFVALESELMRSLPLPPKAPLARYRSAFLARRRRALEHWLSAVLLHPDVGGCEAVRRWVTN